MLKVLKKKAIVALALAMVLMLSGGAIACAATTTAAPTKQSQTNTPPPKAAMTKTALDKLVKAGTIKQVQETAILKALNAAKTSVKAVLDGMVKTKKITQIQEIAILKALSNGAAPNGQEQLTTLVTAGKITKAQATAIQKAMDTGRTSGVQMKTTLDALVKAKTINATQEQAILDNFKSKDNSNGTGGPGGTPPTGTPPSGTTPTGTPPGNPPSGSAITGSVPNGNSAAVTGTAAYSLNGKTQSKTNQTITASTSNESAVKVTSGGNLTLDNSTISKTGATTSDDNSNFYGLNAGVLAESGSTITLSNSTINTDGNGSNAIFATGTDSTINTENITINTTADSSRGLDATLGGTVNAKNATITTAGTHCAALATDRGRGNINVTGGTMNTSGIDSPGIYSTGNITVTGAVIAASNSEAAVVEGKNSISLTDTTISGAKKRGVMLYQSFSGDAEVGTSSFTMNGGSLNAQVGPLFYATNTDTIINLKDAKLTAASGTLLEVGAGNWGTTGSNGAIVALTADNETLIGNIICDNISSITATLKNKTTLTGAIDSVNTGKTIKLVIDKDSIWNVTADSYISALTDNDTTFSNIKDNGHTIYYDANASENSWLSGKTIALSSGGKLTPVQ